MSQAEKYSLYLPRDSDDTLSHQYTYPRDPVEEASLTNATLKLPFLRRYRHEVAMLLALMAFHCCFRFLGLITTAQLVIILVLEFIQIAPFDFAAAVKRLFAASIAELATAPTPITVLAIIRHVVREGVSRHMTAACKDH